MFVTILLLLVGLALIVFGADWLVDGASAIARRFGVSEFVIGLTIVGFGTSMPELVVSLNGAISGVSDIAVGNVVGSNIFNTLLILGLTALVLPIEISTTNRKRDIPFALAVTVLFICIGMRHTLFGVGEDLLTVATGVLFIAMFILYIIFTFRMDKAGGTATESETGKTYRLPSAAALVIIGLAGLVVGGRLFVDSAQSVAKALGVSDKFIAITVLAGGTSLPELATCLVAAFKRRGQLALGNILGSNVFNILLILGCSALVSPISMTGMDIIDMTALLASMIAIAACTYTFCRNRIDRIEGLLLLILFAAYYFWLFNRLQ